MKIIDLPQSVIDLLNLHEAGESWSPPLPIGHQLPSVRRLDRLMLPTSLRAVVTDICDRMQCPMEYVAAPMICALGAAIGTSIGVRPKQKDDWTVTPNLWGAVVGPPGRMKSPAISSALRSVYHLDELNHLAYESAKSAYDVQVIQHKAQEDTLKAEGGAEVGNQSGGRWETAAEPRTDQGGNPIRSVELEDEFSSRAQGGSMLYERRDAGGYRNPAGRK